MTVVQVGRTFMCMSVSHDAAVGHHVRVLVFMMMGRVAIVHMPVVMEVVVLAVVAMRVIVIMRVAVRRAVGVAVLVRVLRRMADVVVLVFAVMAMGLTMDGSIRVHVLMLMRRFLPRAFDLGFAAAAATGRAHDVSPRCRLSRRRAAPKPTGGPLGGQRTQ
jgi:hypothetical protein